HLNLALTALGQLCAGQYRLRIARRQRLGVAGSPDLLGRLASCWRDFDAYSLAFSYGGDRLSDVLRQLDSCRPAQGYTHGAERQAYVAIAVCGDGRAATVEFALCKVHAPRQAAGELPGND